MTIANIETLTRFLTGTDSNSLTAANLLILENKYYEEIVGKIISETVGSKWQFGDFNYTTFPSFTVTMVAGTQAYSLDDWGTTDEETILTIMGAEVLDNGGIWHPLRRITLKEINEQKGLAQSEYQKTNGLPFEYELRDNFMVLYPAPAAANVTLTNGLRIFHLRTADKFTSTEVTTGTKEPGFPSPWHDLLSYGPASDYALSKGLSNVDRLRLEYERRLQEMLDFISRRDQAEDYGFQNKSRNYR